MRTVGNALTNEPLPPINTEAQNAPTVTDDADDGYQVGSRWYTASAEYVCLNAAPGAAVWVDTTAAGGGGGGPHAATHKHAGSDEVAVATPAANGIPKANGSGKLAAGWVSGVLASTDLTNDAALEKTANRAAANGYAPLGSDSRLPAANAPAKAVYSTGGGQALAPGDIGAQTALGFTPENTANKGQANGYASLAANSKVPTAELGGLGADASKFLRGDQTWASPNGAGGSRFPQTVGLGGYVVVTNVGASYDAVAPSRGLGIAEIDFTGVTSLVFGVRVNKVGTGVQSWQLWNDQDSVEIAVINDSGAAGDNKVLTVTVNSGLPTGVKRVRVRAKSTVATDDPVYYGGWVRLS